MKLLHRALLFLILFFTCAFPRTHLYAPLRNQGSVSSPCFFCKEIKANDDDKYLILHRADSIIIQLNPYPYSPGSILIYPTKHVSHPAHLDAIVWADMWLVVQYITDVLSRELGYDSYSVGANIGPRAQGSNPNHLHIHIIPRTNTGQSFLEVACDTQLIQHDIKKLYTQLKPYFGKVK